MKKIIYSLVIMIAAGSLFTSCIEQVEPLGIQDLRFAKAEYIRALKDLRAADAEYRRAEAAVQQAIARYEDALTAGVNADTEYQKLLNEYQALVNQDYAGEVAYNEAERLAKIDSLEKAMEVRELNHKRALAEAEKEMRLAQEDLRVTIRNINLAAGDLTASEKVAIYEAAAVYYWLTEQSILIKNDIAQVQMTIDSLKKNKEIYANKKWDTTSFAYLDADKYYEAKIAEEYAKIDMLMDLYENMPDTSAALADWKAFIDSYDDAINSVKLDSTKMEAGMEVEKALMKESIRDFDVAVAEWIEENWVTEDEGKTYVQPAISAGPKPDKDDAKYYTQKADSLTWTLTKPESVQDFAWQKFVYLMKSYTDDVFPYSKNKPTKNNVIKIKPGASADTAVIIVNDDMKDFLMGAAGNGEDSQEFKYTDENKVKQTLVASYGLWGMLDILKRDKVVGEHEPDPEEIAQAKKDMEDAEKKFDADRKILVEGLAKYSELTKADATLKEKEDKIGAGAASMVKAIDDLIEQFGTVNGVVDGKSFTYNDSLSTFNAFVAFATARKAYLDYSAPTKIDPLDPTKRDSTLFYYSEGSTGGGKAKKATKAFTDLTFSALQNKDFEFRIEDAPGNTFRNGAVPPAKADTSNALALIADQLMSTAVGDMLQAFPIDTTGFVANINKALYNGTYKYDGSKITYADGSTYEPKELTDAKKAVVTAINKYLAAFRAYWGFTKTDLPDYSFTAPSAKLTAYFKEMDDAASTKKASALSELVTEVQNACKAVLNADPECYSKATFKPYKDEAPIVSFIGTKINPKNHALSAVLYSVDPKNGTWTDDDYIYNQASVEAVSAIFKDGKTDFWSYMYYADLYYNLVNDKASENIAGINKLIQQISDDIDADIAQAGKFKEAKYKKDLADWEEKDAKAEVYYAAKLAFTGIYDYDDDDNPIPNDVYALVNADKKAGRDTAVQGKTAKLKGNDITVLFAKNLVGQYVGWSDVLGGEQLELAIELFGEEPWEMFNEYQMHKDQYAAQIAELEVLKKNAQAVFTAKAKYEGYTGEGTSAGSEEDVKKLYEHYKAAYEAALKAIVEYDEFGNIPLNGAGKVNKCLKKINGLEKDLAEIEDKGINWDRKITEAENELEVLKNRQKTGDQALKMAKENYDRLREYLLSQDGVSYVIPVSTADVDDVLMNLDYILRTLGHTVADVYAEVADKIGA